MRERHALHGVEETSMVSPDFARLSLLQEVIPEEPDLITNGRLKAIALVDIEVVNRVTYHLSVLPQQPLSFVDDLGRNCHIIIAYLKQYRAVHLAQLLYRPVFVHPDGYARTGLIDEIIGRHL